MTHVTSAGRSCSVTALRRRISPDPSPLALGRKYKGHTGLCDHALTALTFILAMKHPAATSHAQIESTHTGNVSMRPDSSADVEAMARAGLALFDTSPNPYFLLTIEQRLLWMNGAAQRLLNCRGLLTMHAEMLRCRSQRGSEKLRLGLQALAPSATDPSDHAARRVAIKLEDESHARERLVGCLFGYPAQGIALLMLVSPAPIKIAPTPFLRSLFDLTPAEARVAAALMQGDDLRKIAADNRIAVETVRRHLKSIFSKTDTHRQSQLVAMLLRVSFL